MKMMSKYTLIDFPQREDWESFLNESVSGNLQQSFDYGEAAKMFNPNTRVVRLMATDGDNCVGLVNARYNKRFGFGDRVEVGGVCGCGPVIADVTGKENVLRELIVSLEKIAIKNRVSEALIYRAERDTVLENLGYTLHRTFNAYHVALQKTGKDLWACIAHNKRQNIKKAQEQGVEVFQGKSYDDLVSFYELLTISGKRAGFNPYPFSYFNSFLKIFGANKVRIFLAAYDGKPVASVFVVVHGDTAYALGAGSRDEVWSVRPNDILHWKAMEWACGEGLSRYHMGYVSEPPPVQNSPGWGLWMWKKKWAGQLEKIYTYHKVYMPKFKKYFLNPYEKIFS